MSHCLEDALDEGGDEGTAAALVGLRDEVANQTFAQLAAGEAVVEEADALVVTVARAAGGALTAPLGVISPRRASRKPGSRKPRYNARVSRISAQAPLGAGHAAALSSEALLGGAQVRATHWRRPYRRGGRKLASGEVEVDVLTPVGVVVPVKDLAEPVVLTFEAEGNCVTWDGQAWVEDPAVVAWNGTCASTHLSSFAVAALVGSGSGACRALRGTAAADLYASSSYDTWLILQALSWFAIAGDGVAQFAAQAQGKKWSEAVLTVPGAVAATFVALGAPRFVYALWAREIAAERRVCFELTARPALALFDAATPFLLCALSAIVLCWLQIVMSRKRLSGALEGKYLWAFGAWNFAYVFVGAGAAVGALAFDDGRHHVARGVARFALAYGALAHVAGGGVESTRQSEL